MNGIDRQRLETLADRIRADPALAHTQSLVVSQHGRIMFEHHFGGAAPDEPTDVFSITKSVLSTLVGIAVESGAVPSLDEPVRGLLDDSAAGAMTIRHLLTMSTGRACSGSWDIDSVMGRRDSWTRHLLRAPTLEAPGLHFRYDNGAAHILATVLQRAVGRPLRAFAEEVLFGPLAVECGAWPVDPDGVNYGFGHLQLSAYDLVKLGTLYLCDGKWHGRQIVPRDYVAEATRVRVRGGPPEGLPYGFLWWIDDHLAPRRFLAAGYAGQFVLVLPADDLVVVGTGDASRLSPSWTSAWHLAATLASTEK